MEIGYLAQQEPVNEQADGTGIFPPGGRLGGRRSTERAGQYLFYGADVFKPLSTLSGGEWSRLRLALLVRRKPNLLLLDEPTNHLDVASREALEEALEDFPGTVLAISHDRYFINRLAKRVWELRQGRIAAYLGNYDDFKEKREERTAREAAQAGSNSPRIVKAKPVERRQPDRRSLQAAIARAGTRDARSGSSARSRSWKRSWLGRTNSCFGSTRRPMRTGLRRAGTSGKRCRRSSICCCRNGWKSGNEESSRIRIKGFLGNIRMLSPFTML